MNRSLKKILIFALLAQPFLFYGSCIGYYVSNNKNEQKPTVQITKTLDDKAGEYYVARVIDGDTLDLNDGRRVRLLGIDTPELRKKGVGKEFYADEARKRLEELICNKKINVEYDITDNNKQDRDKYGRTLAYVIANGQNTSIMLLKEGYARKFMHENLKYRAEIEKAEQEAREARKGIWARELK